MRKMIFCLSVALMSLVVASCGEPAATNNAANKPANAANNAAPASANAAAIESEIKKAASDLAAALSKNDAAAAEKMYTDSYMFVAPDGSVATAKQRIDSMKSGEMKYESVTYDEATVRSNPEGNGAVMIGKATVKGKAGARTMDGQYRVTLVWSKTKDGWKVASGQSTEITATAAPASNTAPSNTAAANTAGSNSAPANK